MFTEKLINKLAVINYIESAITQSDNETDASDAFAFAVNQIYLDATKKPLSIKKAAQPLPWFLTTI